MGLGGSGPPGGEIPGSNQGPPRDPPGTPQGPLKSKNVLGAAPLNPAFGPPLRPLLREWGLRGGRGVEWLRLLDFVFNPTSPLAEWFR